MLARRLLSTPFRRFPCVPVPHFAYAKYGLSRPPPYKCFSTSEGNTDKPTINNNKGYDSDNGTKGPGKLYEQVKHLLVKLKMSPTTSDWIYTILRWMLKLGLIAGLAKGIFWLVTSFPQINSFVRVVSGEMFVADAHEHFRRSTYLDSFEDRYVELQIFEDVLHHAPNIVHYVSGPLGVGKSSLCTYAFNKFSCSVLSINLRSMDINNEEQFVKILLDSVRPLATKRIPDVLPPIVAHALDEKEAKVSMYDAIQTIETVIKILQRDRDRRSRSMWYKVYSFLSGYKLPEAVIFIDELQGLKGLMTKDEAGKAAVSNFLGRMVALGRDTKTCHVFITSSLGSFLFDLQDSVIKRDYLDVITVKDIAKKDGVAALMSMSKKGMSEEEASSVYSIIGGRFQDLREACILWRRGSSLKEILAQFEFSSRKTVEQALKSVHASAFVTIMDKMNSQGIDMNVLIAEGIPKATIMSLVDQDFLSIGMLEYDSTGVFYEIGIKARAPRLLHFWKQNRGALNIYKNNK